MQDNDTKNVVVLEFDRPNRNGLVYSKAAAEQMKARIQQRLNEGTFFVTMGNDSFPSSMNVDIDKVSHIVKDLEVSDVGMFAKLKTLKTPMGNIAMELEEADVDYHIVPCGEGKIAPDGTVTDMRITHFSMNYGKRQ